MKSPLHFQNQAAFELADGGTRVVVCPEHGARILRWEKDGREIITWPEKADWSKILKVRGGNPVLFPFIARHFVDGRPEVWKDETGTERRMPQHGFARDAKFSVIEDDNENSIRMRLTDSEATYEFYPFRFRFDVVVALLPGAKLEVRFETKNVGNHPMPYYAGHHFYLAIPHTARADWTLHVPCAAWGRQTPEGAIFRESAGKPDIGLNDENAIDRFQIGPAEDSISLANTKTGQRLVMDLKQPASAPWYAVTTWTEKAESDFYCVEPWLGLPNAIHHREGLRTLLPGGAETASVVLDASQW